MTPPHYLLYIYRFREMETEASNGSEKLVVQGQENDLLQYNEERNTIIIRYNKIYVVKGDNLVKEETRYKTNQNRLEITLTEN